MASAPVRGGTVVVGLPADFDAFNEFVVESAFVNSFVSYGIFQTLVRYDENHRFIPALADSFGVSGDDMSVTFRLRDDIHWHDGVPVTSDDVVWSFDVSIDEETAYPNRSDLQNIEAAERIDERRVRFRFARVHADPLADFAEWAPMPKHLLENVPPSDMRNAEFNRNPVGNGPFRFVSWRANEQVVFEAYEDFYAGRPYIDRIVFRIIPERTTLVTELLTGGVDLVPGIPPAEMARIEASPNADPLTYPSVSNVFIMYNIRDPRFEDPRLRRALTLAIDRQAIVDALLFGYGEVANGPVTPAQWAHDPDLAPLPFDSDAAIALLAEAGWRDTDGDGWLDKDGRPLRFEMITNQDNALRSSILVVVQDNLGKIGVDVQPRNREFNVLVDDLVSGSFETIVLGFNWSLRFDPSSLLLTDAPFNGGGYANPRADSLALLAIATPERDDAEPFWNEYQRIVQNDHPISWLFVENERWGVSRRMRDVWTHTPDSYGVFQSARFWWIPENEQ